MNSKPEVGIKQKLSGAEMHRWLLEFDLRGLI